MELQLEEISKSNHSSFRIMFNPNLSDLFFWHFHPELELVYIEGANGTRHVGEHISGYQGSDLVFIGSNIPHLNFDFGVKTNYHQIVIHLRPDFLHSSFEEIPEFNKIGNLFDKAPYAISFDEKVKKMVGDKMKTLQAKDHFQQFLTILGIFQLLAADEGCTLLHQKPVQNLRRARDQQRLSSIYQYIDLHYRDRIDLSEVAAISNLTKEAFCRYFKKMTRLTFTEFVNQYRIEMAKKLLLQDVQVTDVCFECGFESISYFNRVFKRVTKMSPSAFRNQHLSRARSK